MLDLCAFAGVSPLDELTPRELVRLAKTRQTIAWDHTSVIIATAVNMMRTKHREVGKPEAVSFKNLTLATNKEGQDTGGDGG